ncbi:unnamed protein product, partial [Pelagomonas calceolata]
WLLRILLTRLIPLRRVPDPLLRGLRVGGVLVADERLDLAHRFIRRGLVRLRGLGALVADALARRHFTQLLLERGVGLLLGLLGLLVLDHRAEQAFQVVVGESWERNRREHYAAQHLLPGDMQGLGCRHEQQRAQPESSHLICSLWWL